MSLLEIGLFVLLCAIALAVAWVPIVIMLGGLLAGVVSLGVGLVWVVAYVALFILETFDKITWPIRRKFRKK